MAAVTSPVVEQGVVMPEIFVIHRYSKDGRDYDLADSPARWEEQWIENLQYLGYDKPFMVYDEPDGEGARTCVLYHIPSGKWFREAG